ncbi:MAG: SHD1 domain-containing protein [Aureliella sp.]
MQHIHQLGEPKKMLRRGLGIGLYLCCVLVGWTTGAEVFAQDTEPRTWRDVSGVFTVEGKLRELSTKKVKIQLPDGKVIEVARDRLSKQDREFLSVFERERNPFMTSDALEQEEATVESKAMEAASTESDASGRRSFPMTELPPVLPTHQRVAIFSDAKTVERFETKRITQGRVLSGVAYVADVATGSRVSSLLALDPKQGKVAISVGPSRYSSHRPQRSRVYVGSLPKGPFEVVVDMEDSFHLLDHHPDSDRTLAAGARLGDSGDSELILLEGLAKASLREVARFRLPVDSGRRKFITQAKLIGEHRAIVLIDNVAYCWDLSKGEQVYQTDPNHRFTGELVFSADRQVMAIPDTTGVHLVRTKDASDLGFIASGGAYGMTVEFDPRQNRLAFNHFDSWGLVDYSSLERRNPVTASWTLRGGPIRWIGPDLLLAGTGVVIDTEYGIPVWRYTARWQNSKLWEDSITLVDTSRGLRLTTMPLPHSELKRARESMPKLEELLATDVGTHVKLELRLPTPTPEGVDPKTLKLQLQRLAEQAGWVPDNSAGLTLEASIAKGKTYTDRYQAYVPGTINRDFEKVEITPMISRIELREGSQVIWGFQSKNGRSTGYGNSTLSKEEYIKRKERALPAFFDGIILPIRIAKPPFTYGFGASYESGGSWKPMVSR